MIQIFTWLDVQSLAAERCILASGSNISLELGIEWVLTVEEREALLTSLELYYIRTSSPFQGPEYLRMATSQDINKGNDQNSDEEND